MTGRLLHARAADTVPVAGAVVLHRLSTVAQGPVDTVRADAAGRFAFRFAPDTAAIFLVSARHGGIEYFSRPVRGGPGTADTLDLFVHDTSSTAPVALAERYVLVSRATQGGRRSVLDLLVVRNPGPLTRSAPDSAAASWTLPLAEGVGDVSAGEGEFSAAAFEQRGDSLAYLAPLLPGERQLVVRYTVPAGGRLAIPTPPADSVVLMLEERDARATGPGFARADSTVIEGQTYFRWVRRGGAGPLEVTFPGTGPSRDPLPWLVALLGLALVTGVALALRRRGGAAPAVPAAPRQDEVSRLVERIAQLDAAHAESDGAARDAYLAERAALRAELDRALASKVPPR